MPLAECMYCGGTGWSGNGTGLANPDLAFVIIDVLLLFLINVWQSAMVGRARKKYGVTYPNMYAHAGDTHVYGSQLDERKWTGAGSLENQQELLPSSHMSQQSADAYNAVQRAHQNTLENQPLFLLLLLFGSLGFPLISAGIGFLWLLGRVAYSVGYYHTPSSRVPGAILSFVAMFALFGLNIALVVYLLMEQETIPW